MSRLRFAFVSNSEEVGETLKRHSDPSLEDVTIHRATMEDAVPIARDLLQHGTHVVIGSGGTGNLLAREIGQNVVKLNRSPFDLLQALAKAKRMGHRITVTTFADPIEQVEFFEQLLKVSIRQVVFSRMADLETGIADSVRQGFRVVVGGGACCQIAESQGVGGVVIIPRKENIVQALQEARAVALSQNAQRRAFDAMASILHTVRDGVIAVDDDGRLGLVNDAAWEIVRGVLQQTDRSSLIGTYFPTELNALGTTRVLHSGMAETDKVVRLRNVHLAVSSFPILVEGEPVGAASIFREAAKIHRLDRKIKERMHRKGFAAKLTFGDIAHRSVSMRRVIERGRLYAKSDAAVLIEGETGTGKEMLAQGIHNASRRADAPFVAVNCSALPEALLESELFGYEEGAFTGARRGGKIGLFELADQGTLFLDEIADISPAMQVRLLRAIEEREIMRVGGDAIIPVDVRVISASQRDLHKDSSTGRFRMDLYFRLATLTLRLPPLRERPDDLPAILDALCDKLGMQCAIDPALMAEMQAYRWPGNVREFESLLKTFAAVQTGRHRDDGILAELFAEMRSVRDPPAQVANPTAGKGGLKQQLSVHERQIIEATLAACRYNRAEAAQKLGISINSLWRKSKQGPKPAKR